MPSLGVESFGTLPSLGVEPGLGAMSFQGMESVEGLVNRESPCRKGRDLYAGEEGGD